MFSESHCHLTGITPERITEAEKLGFRFLLTSGIDLESSIEAVKLASNYTIVKGCIGIHPWYADEYNNEVEREFRSLIENDEVVAISEIGLDFVGRMTKKWVHEDRYIDRSIQIQALEDQLELARDLGYPAIVHDRSKGTELLDLLIDSDNVESGLAIHGFSKDSEYVDKAVKNKIFISIGLGTLRNAEQEFLKVVAKTPLEYLLTETDSNDPLGVLEVCDRIAELKGSTRDKVGTVTTRNLVRLCSLT